MSWTLAWPWALVLLPLPWIVARFAPAAPEESTALRVPDVSLFDTAGRASGWQARPATLLAWAAWILLVAAAARPQLVGEPVSLPVSGRDLMLAVDLSGSMEERDFRLEDQWVRRLDVSKVVASDFIKRRKGDRVGLILFGLQAYLQAPLTFDRKTVNTLLNEAEIGLAGRETAIGDAIGLATKVLTRDATQHRVLILMTDGANTAGVVDPIKAAELAATRDLKIYTVGIGAPVGGGRGGFAGSASITPSGELDEATLTKIAKITGGRYFRARDTAELQGIYDELDALEPVPSDESGFRPVHEYYPWPAAAALLLAVAAALMRSGLLSGSGNGGVADD